jgi:hypothetical protein
MRAFIDTQFSPIAMIQRVMTRRKLVNGTSSLRIANTIIGTNQNKVFRVMTLNVSMPLRCLSTALVESIPPSRRETCGILAVCYKAKLFGPNLLDRRENGMCPYCDPATMSTPETIT